MTKAPPTATPYAAADEIATFIPNFEGMGITGVEQIGVRIHEPGRDPGEVPTAFAVSTAGGDDSFEVTVECHRVVVLSYLPAQTFGNVQLVKEKN